MCCSRVCSLRIRFLCLMFGFGRVGLVFPILFVSVAAWDVSSVWSLSSDSSSVSVFVAWWSCSCVHFCVVVRESKPSCVMLKSMFMAMVLSLSSLLFTVLITISVWVWHHGKSSLWLYSMLVVLCGVPVSWGVSVFWWLWVSV